MCFDEGKMCRRIETPARTVSTRFIERLARFDVRRDLSLAQRRERHLRRLAERFHETFAAAAVVRENDPDAGVDLMSDPLERQEHLHRLVSVLGFLEYRAVGAFHDGVRADDHERRGLLLLQPRRDLHRFVRRRRGGVFGATGERGFIQIFVEIGNDDVELQPL